VHDADPMSSGIGTSVSDAIEPARAMANRQGSWSRFFGPPGVLFYLATTIAIIVALDANSRASFEMLLLALPLWLLLAATWFLRFLGAAWTERLRLPWRHWLRWLVIPAAMGLVFVLTRYDVPFDVRLTAAGSDSIRYRTSNGSQTGCGSSSTIPASARSVSPTRPPASR
jgi:hypothetical protein